MPLEYFLSIGESVLSVDWPRKGCLVTVQNPLEGVGGRGSRPTSEKEREKFLEP